MVVALNPFDTELRLVLIEMETEKPRQGEEGQDESSCVEEDKHIAIVIGNNIWGAVV